MPARRVTNANKALKGTAQPVRLNKAEPPAPPAMPYIDDALLTPLARTLLPSVAAPLLERGTLTAGDAMGLIALVNAVADGVSARRLIDAAGGEVQAVETAAGKVRYVLHPAVSIRDAADKRVQHWLGKFGLTPASRLSAPVAVETLPAEVNPFEDIENS